MDTQQIKELIELMVANELNRIEIQEGETHILLKRGGSGEPVVSQPPAPAAPPPVPATPNAPPAQAAPAATSQAEDSSEVFIRSPMVGTFYTASDPDSPPFVSAGDTVSSDTVVCLVEAMKVFNEIKAEVNGRISRVLVKNAEAVEFDQPLFAVTPA
jgi:acetyl-CoA carboxylase biotin carboxyl carrier protein